MTAPGFDADVAIVGYGPVGQALAALLGRTGHRVAVFELFTDIYRLPRAVHLDHEIMRLLQSLGLADTLAEEMIPVHDYHSVHDYHWYGADDKLLLRFDMEGSLTRSVGSRSRAFARRIRRIRRPGTARRTPRSMRS